MMPGCGRLLILCCTAGWLGGCGTDHPENSPPPPMRGVNAAPSRPSSPMTLPAAIASFCAAPAPTGMPLMSAGVDTDIPTTRLLYVTDSRFHEALRCIVTSEEQWNTLWSFYGNREEPPKVDFTTHAVLFASMGEQPTSSHYIRIERVQAVGDTTYAQVRLLFPEEDQVGQALTQPAVAVLVPRDLGRVVFLE